MYALSLTVLAVVVIALIVGTTANAETGWPVNEAGEPTNGGNWQGSGQQDIPPEGIKADWYNDTKNDSAWVVEDGDNILRSFSAFDYKFDLTIQEGGILTLDSVAFSVNSSDENHRVVIEDGGQLIITNSSFACFEIYIEQGGELYFHPGNGSNTIAFDSVDSPGIMVTPGSLLELLNTSVSGPNTLVTVNDENAVIEHCSFSTSGDETACILLKASAPIPNNMFYEGSPTGTYAIIAEAGVTSEIYDNTFNGFRHGGQSKYGRAIMSYGPIEIYDNLFTRMVMDNAQSDPYVIYFIGNEPTDHGGQPVWETNRFRGKNGIANNERVNIFKQAWNVEVTVNNANSGNPIEGAEVNIEDNGDFVVATEMTDEFGKAYFEIAEFYVSALDDGDSGDSTKNKADQNPYDIEASKDTETDVLDDQTINVDKQFALALDLLEFDFGVSDLGFPEIINIGDTINFDATVFNNGYDRDSTVKVEFYIVDGTRAENKLGETNVLVDLDFVHAYLDAVIPVEYANTDVTFMAKTIFANEENTANDAFTSASVHINEKPTVAITAPADGEIFSELMAVTGTAADDVSVSEVQVNITGSMDWTKVTGTTDWQIDIDTVTLGLMNGVYELNARAMDGNGSFSDVATITFNVLNKPKISITSPAADSLLLGNTTITMLGSSTKLDTDIQRVFVTIDETTVINATKVSGDWSQWQLPLKTVSVDVINTLSDGEHTFMATVEDGAGLTNTVTVTYTVYSTDPATDPELIITTGHFNLTADTWVAGTATDDYKVTKIQYRVNDGDWSDAQDVQNLGSDSVTWRAQITLANKDLAEGTNIVYIRADDDDSNTTKLLQFTVLAEGLVDLTIGEVVQLNELGTALKASDLKVDNVIKIVVTIHVAGTGINLPQVAVRITIGGDDAGTKTEENVTGQFDVTFSLTLKASMEGKKTFSIKVDPANIIDENNEAGDAETNNVYDETFPGTSGIGKSGTVSDNGDSFLPGFEVSIMVAAMAFGGFMALVRKRRE